MAHARVCCTVLPIIALVPSIAPKNKMPVFFNYSPQRTGEVSRSPENSLGGSSGSMVPPYHYMCVGLNFVSVVWYGGTPTISPYRSSTIPYLTPREGMVCILVFYQNL
jgi:hypothetical protein